MDIRYVDLKSLRKLEALSAENTYERFRERNARIPMENDQAEVSNLRERLEEKWNPLAEQAIVKVEETGKKLESELGKKYAKYRQLLAEKSLLLAETSKQGAAARAAIRGIKGAERRMNVKDRAALARARLSQKQTVKRMEYNAVVLRRWDESELCMNKRRDQLQKMMGLPPRDAERYEHEFAEKMTLERRRHTYYADYDREKGMIDGKVVPIHQEGPLIIRINANCVATPIDDADYFGDNGIMAGYFALMDYMPEITRLIRRGMSVGEILSDPGMRERAAELITYAYPVTVAVTRVGTEERYQVMDIESQRRIVIARLFGVGSVPARVDTSLKNVER